MSEKRKIFDCFVFFLELDLLELRLNILDPDVDYFVLVESTLTYMGDEKPLYYEDNKQRFAQFHHKIIHIIVDDMPKVAPSSWDREALQRSAFGRGLSAARPDDLIIVSDLDEIIKPEALRASLKNAAGAITYFEGVYYHFHLNWRVKGRKDLKTSRMIEFKHFKDGWLTRKTKGCRSVRLPQWAEYLLWLPYAGWRHGAFLRRQICREGCWHFSYMMSPREIRAKVAAYSHTHRNTPRYTDAGRIEARIAARRSMFANPIEVAPLSEMPLYVQQNLDKYGVMLDLESQPASA